MTIPRKEPDIQGRRFSLVTVTTQSVDHFSDNGKMADRRFTRTGVGNVQGGALGTVV